METLLTDFVIPFLWGLVVLSGFIGWGSAAARLSGAPEPDWGLSAGWGMALVIAFGGVLSLAGAALPPVLMAVVVVGAVLHLGGVLKGRASGRPSAWAGFSKRLRSHEGAVLAARFDAEGQRVVSGSVGGAVRLWQTDGGLLLSTLRGHEADVEDVAFRTSDGRLVTASADGRICIWEADAGTMVSSFAAVDDDLGHPIGPEDLRRRVGIGRFGHGVGRTLDAPYLLAGRFLERNQVGGVVGLHSMQHGNDQLILVEQGG